MVRVTETAFSGSPVSAPRSLKRAEEAQWTEQGSEEEVCLQEADRTRAPLGCQGTQPSLRALTQESPGDPRVGSHPCLRGDCQRSVRRCVGEALGRWFTPLWQETYSPQPLRH